MIWVRIRAQITIGNAVISRLLEFAAEKVPLA
jgi:hypothetical protein